MDQLEVLITDVGGIGQAARICGVHLATVRRWRRGATPLPQSCYRALYHASRWGRSERTVLATNQHQALQHLVDVQRRQIAALQHQVATLMRVGEFRSANDPIAAIA